MSISKIIVSVMVVMLSWSLISGIIHAVDENDPYDDHTSVTAEKTYEWAVWDGEGVAPNARIVIQNGNANREYGLGSIHGAAYNNTGKNLSYIQISYGIYNEGGAKVGSCLANEMNLSASTAWEYEAICGSLPNGNLSFKVEEVTYW